MPPASSKLIPWPEHKPYDKQAVPVPGTKRPGQSHHYQNGVWGLIDEKTPNISMTLDQLFTDSLQVGLNSPFLGRRNIIATNPLKFAPTYTWLTYGDVDLKRRYIGSALHSLFQQGAIGGGELPTVGIWAPNCPEWQIVDIACQTYQKVTVSLYDTLGKDSVEFM